MTLHDFLEERAEERYIKKELARGLIVTKVVSNMTTHNMIYMPVGTVGLPITLDTEFYYNPMQELFDGIFIVDIKQDVWWALHDNRDIINKTMEKPCKKYPFISIENQKLGLINLNCVDDSDIPKYIQAILEQSCDYILKNNLVRLWRFS